MEDLDKEQQEHVNGLISEAKRKGKDSASADFTTQLEAKDTELSTATAKIMELETEVTKKTALSASDEEYRTAQDKRFTALENDNKALRLENDEKETAAKMAKFDSSDKDALIEAGFDVKYVDGFLLPKLTANRGVNDDKAFYKDKTGAEVERSSLITSIVDSHPELVNVQRDRGNNPAHNKGDTTPDKSQFETLLAKSQKGDLNRSEAVQLSTLANEMKQEKTGE